MKSIVLLLVSSFCLNNLFAQENRVWATYFGGSGDESFSFESAIDDNGNVYIAGRTASTSGIASNGFQNTFGGGSYDAFLAKFDPSGNLLWSTYYGGTGDEYANALAVDIFGFVYIGGLTSSTNAMASGGYQNALAGGSDAFLVKFDSNGNRIWGTYYGGASSDFGYGIATDNSGNIFLCGTTQSNSGIAIAGHDNSYGGSQDAFLVKFNAGGARMWGTYFGGTAGDIGNSVAVDGTGNIYLAGYTGSANITSGGFNTVIWGGGDGFLVKFNTAGVHQWSTYYGGPANNDVVTDVISDASNNVYISGSTTSTSGIASGGHQNTFGGIQDAFLVKFNASGSRLWATYYGGTDDDRDSYCSIDVNGKVYLSGIAVSSASISSSGFQNSYGGGVRDAFLVRFDSNGVRESATYFGSTDSDFAGEICADLLGNVYLVGYTNSASGISSSGYQNTFGGLYDAFLVKFTTCAYAPLSPGSITGTSSICSGTTNTYSISPVAGANSYTWTLPSGWSGTSTTNSITTTASATSGNITVTANNACGSSIAATLPITVNSIPAAPSSISGNTAVCQGSANVYSVSSDPSATSYTWTLPGGWSGSSTTNSITTTAGPTGGNISVSASNSCGTSSSTSNVVSVSTASPSTPGVISGSTSICSGTPTTYSVAAVPGATSYIWSIPAGWTGTSNTNSITVTDNGTGGVISVFAQNACGNSTFSTISLAVSTSIPSNPGTISGNSAVCLGSSNTYSVNAVSGATSYTWTLPSGWTGSSSTNSINATASSSTGNITVTANNSCGNSTASSITILSVLTIPVNPGTISGSTTVCDGSSNTYSITPAGDASTYNWTLPSGWGGSSTSSSISTTAASNGGVISVTGTNFCGTSTASNLTVSVNTIPATPIAISGLNPICEGTTNTYSVPTVSGVTSYSWTLPPGWSGSSTTNTINATASANGGTISVMASNSCGLSSPANLTITVNPLPTVGLNLSIDTLCINAAAVSLTGGSPSGGTYSGTGVNSGTFNPALSGTGNFTISYSFIDANSCSNTATDNIVVDNCLGLSDFNDLSNLKIYPNPTSGILFIENAASTNVSTNVKVIDLTGKIVLTINVNSNLISLDLSTLSNGMYFIHIQTDKTTTIKKITKE